MVATKPVVTLDNSGSLFVDGVEVGHLHDGGGACLMPVDPWGLPANVFRAIADWLDQWEGATRLSEVGE